MEDKHLIKAIIKICYSTISYVLRNIDAR